MADSLLNSTLPTWNIPMDSDLSELGAASLEAMYPSCSLAHLGGGDAPGPHPSTRTPKLRSRLFTISTRSVLASHSQLNLNYTTTTTKVDAEEFSKRLSPPSPVKFEDVDKAFQLIGDEKVNLNINECNQLKTGCRKRKDFPFNPMKKRSIHHSLEDLNSYESSSAREPKEDKNRRKSAPITTTRGQMIEAANELLVEENRHLHSTIKGIGKHLLVSKIALHFALRALARNGRKMKDLENVKLEKEQQCAARLILHSLLLNCWRNTKRELNVRMDDNSELKRSVENFSLQVQVLRHIQTSEKQKSQEKSALIDNLNDELGVIKGENTVMRKEIEKMESKLNSIQASSQNLSDENQLLSKEIASVTENRDSLLHTLQRERARAEQFGRDNETMKETLRHLEDELNESTDQKAHWQERARCSESEVWELQLHLEERNENVQELSSECCTLREEKTKLLEEKQDLSDNLEQTTLALKTLGEKTDELHERYEEVKVERNTKAKAIQELQQNLQISKKEFQELERELLNYKLHNVRRRREWANALYFFVCPIDAVRRKWI